MEIRVNNEELNFIIDNESITGITTNNKEELINILSINYPIKNSIYIDNKLITNKNANIIKKKISIVNSNIVIQPHLDTVIDNMDYIIREKRLIIKDPLKKMQDSLKIVGLNKSYLNRTMNSLSISELKLIGIAISLLSNPEIIILDEPFIELDKKNEQKISRLLIKLKESYNKLVIIISDDSNILYKYTDRIVFIKNNKVILDGKTNEVYKRVSYLRKNSFDIPDIVLFTYIVRKNKKINLNYHKDIRDIIKDIYKHV